MGQSWIMHNESLGLKSTVKKCDKCCDTAFVSVAMMGYIFEVHGKLD